MLYPNSYQYWPVFNPQSGGTTCVSMASANFEFYFFWQAREFDSVQERRHLLLLQLLLCHSNHFIIIIIIITKSVLTTVTQCHKYAAGATYTIIHD